MNQICGDREDLTLGGKHTMQYTDDVLWNCTLETYIILGTNVTQINLIFKIDGKGDSLSKELGIVSTIVAFTPGTPVLLVYLTIQLFLFPPPMML